MINLKACIKNLFGKKLRAILTISSISIGVCSVIVISSIGNLGKEAINQQLDSLGVGGLSVMADTTNGKPGLTAEDLVMIKGIKNVQAAIPIMAEYTQIMTHDSPANVFAWGIDSGAKQLISLNARYGRLLNSYDVMSEQYFCLIDEKLAKINFKRVNVVGESISVLFNGVYEDFKIIGVVSSENVLQNFVGEYVPYFIYVPYTTMQTLSGRWEIDQIAVKTYRPEDTDTASLMIENALRAKNGENTSYNISNMAKQKEKLNNLLNIAAIVFSGIAGISLLVAGLGIMTIMLVSVYDRTREIGIKKSIGATKGIIMAEFLMEAFTISILGSIIGSIAGVVIVMAGCVLIGVPIMISVPAIVTSIAVTILIGGFFGVYPAYTASILKPVDALRNE